MFYNTNAPGIIVVVSKAKPIARRNKVLLINASREFAKGDPKNYIPEDAVLRIAKTFIAWDEVEKFSQIVSKDEIAKHGYNISPSHYIHAGDDETYRPIAEIVEELRESDAAAREISSQVEAVLVRLGL